MLFSLGDLKDLILPVGSHLPVGSLTVSKVVFRKISFHLGNLHPEEQNQEVISQILGQSYDS